MFDWVWRMLGKKDIPFSMQDLEGMIGNEFYVRTYGSGQPMGGLFEINFRMPGKMTGYFLPSLSNITYPDESIFIDSQHNDYLFILHTVIPEKPPKLMGWITPYDGVKNTTGYTRNVMLHLVETPEEKSKGKITF